MHTAWSFPAVLLLAVHLDVGEAGKRGDPRPPPHRWALEDRLNERRDVASIRTRIETAQATGRLAATPPPGAFYLDGTANPELFLPWELFQRLILQSYLAPDGVKEEFRHHVAQSAGALHLQLPVRFWSDLAAAANPLIASLQLQKDTVEKARTSGSLVDSVALAALQRQDCRLRAKSLAAAREVLGEEFFDRLLYEVIAPSTVIIGSISSDQKAAQQWISGNCS